MITSNLRINQISPEAYGWYLRYLAAVDAKDIDAYGAFLAEDCESWSNNGEVVRGKSAILAGLAAYWPSFRSLEHDLLSILGRDDAFALEAFNHYVRHDGRSVSVRAVALTERGGDGRVVRFRFYTDLAPLFAP